MKILQFLYFPRSLLIYPSMSKYFLIVIAFASRKKWSQFCGKYKHLINKIHDFYVSWSVVLLWVYVHIKQAEKYARPRRKWKVWSLLEPAQMLTQRIVPLYPHNSFQSTISWKNINNQLKSAILLVYRFVITTLSSIKLSGRLWNHFFAYLNSLFFNVPKTDPVKTFSSPCHHPSTGVHVVCVWRIRYFHITARVLR